MKFYQEKLETFVARLHTSATISNQHTIASSTNCGTTLRLKKTALVNLAITPSNLYQFARFLTITHDFLIYQIKNGSIPIAAAAMHWQSNETCWRAWRANWVTALEVVGSLVWYGKKYRNPRNFPSTRSVTTICSSSCRRCLCKYIHQWQIKTRTSWIIKHQRWLWDSVVMTSVFGQQIFRWPVNHRVLWLTGINFVGKVSTIRVSQLGRLSLPSLWSQ